MRRGLVLCCLAAAVSLAVADTADAPRLRFGALSDVHLYEPGDEDTFVRGA